MLTSIPHFIVRAVFNGIVQQVVQDTAEVFAGKPDRLYFKFSLQVAGELHFFKQEVHVGHDVLKDRLYQHMLRILLFFDAALQAADRGEVLDGGFESAHRGINMLDQLAEFFVFDALLLQQTIESLNQAVDVENGCFEVVRSGIVKVVEVAIGRFQFIVLDAQRLF